MTDTERAFWEIWYRSLVAMAAAIKKYKLQQQQPEKKGDDKAIPLPAAIVECVNVAEQS